MEEVKVAKTRIQFSGKFDLNSYYKNLYGALSGKGYDVEEGKYTHKTKPEGDKVEIEWTCTKRLDDYTRFKIFARTLITDLIKVQVQVDGVPASRHIGSVELELTASVQKDFTNRWETSPLLKYFQRIYENYIYKETLERLMNQLQAETDTVENEIKSLFNLHKKT